MSPKNKTGVHATHCRGSGCKYGEPDCPVVAGKVFGVDNGMDRAAVTAFEDMEGLRKLLKRYVDRGEQTEKELIQAIKKTDLETAVEWNAIVCVERGAQATIAAHLIKALDAGKWEMPKLRDYAVLQAVQCVRSLYGGRSTNPLAAIKRAAQGEFWGELAEHLGGLRYDND